MDAVLGRKVLNHLDAHPELLRMHTYGIAAGGPESPCGAVACLAGHALILSGEYRLIGFESFVTASGGRLPGPIEDVAAGVLRLTYWERYGDDDQDSLFDAGQGEREAIARFRALVEAAEARQGASGGAVGQ